MNQSIFLGVCLVVVTGMYGIVTTFADSTEVEEQMKNIRTWYAEVEALQHLRQENIEFKCEGGPMEGVMTRRYRRDTGEIVRLDIGRLFSDHDAADEIYYFRKGELFFVLISASSWRFAGEKGDKPGEASTVDSLRESRLYFAKGRCIRVLEKKVSSGDPENLRGLIAKAENRELDLSAPESEKLISDALKIAGVLAKVKDAKAVTSFFCED